MLWLQVAIRLQSLIQVERLRFSLLGVGQVTAGLRQKPPVAHLIVLQLELLVGLGLQATPKPR